MGKTFVKPQKVDEKTFVRKSKPRRPDRLNKIPRLQIRPKSAPPSRQSNQEPVRSQPFLAYGCGADERETSTKKTFNIRASSAVSRNCTEWHLVDEVRDRFFTNIGEQCRPTQMIRYQPFSASSNQDLFGVEGGIWNFILSVPDHCPFKIYSSMFALNSGISVKIDKINQTPLCQSGPVQRVS